MFLGLNCFLLLIIVKKTHNIIQIIVTIYEQTITWSLQLSKSQQVHCIRALDLSSFILKASMISPINRNDNYRKNFLNRTFIF